MPTIDVPDFNQQFFCIVDRKKPLLAALISSYANIPNEYLVMFEYSDILVSSTETNIDELEVHVISNNRAKEFDIRIRNALMALGGCKYLILAGLDDNQKSYLNFLDDYNVIEIENTSEVDLFLSALVDKSEYIFCNENDIYNGLYLASISNSLLAISEAIEDISTDFEDKEGIIIIEKIDAVSTIIAINYAISMNLNFKIIDPPKTDGREINSLVEQWKGKNDKQYFNDLSALLYSKIENINFGKYKFATFFTFGAPYSLILNNYIPITYVNNQLNPDFFIFNNIYIEKQEQFYSAIVFSPLEFGEDEETKFVIDKLSEEKYFVRELVGKEASVFNIDNHVKEFPCEIIHFCSHGGEVNGFTLVEEFLDREGINHVIEYDEVVSFAPDKSEEKIEVTSKYIWRKFDGLPWKGKEFEAVEYPHYVFVDMMSAIKNFKGKSRKRKEKIMDSCAIKCSDFNYQAMFNTISGSHSNPLVFNNTCWSWSDISYSFLYTGARGYIGTLWSVNNDVAKNTAEIFYENLFDDTILNALQKAFTQTKGNDNENIYIFWGLHFATLKTGNSIENSRKKIASKLLHSFYRWRDHLKNAKDKDTEESINRLINWDSNQLEKYFSNDTLELLTPPKSKL